MVQPARYPRRRKGPTTHVGGRGEDIAAEYLESLGYDILERNVRTGRAELDIVAREGDVLCFVEVRSVSDPRFGNPLESLDVRKQRRVVTAARAYLRTRWDGPLPSMRFDAVGVTLTRPPVVQLVRAAFGAGL